MTITSSKSFAEFKPKGRIIITGATSGLGRGLTERFIKAGWLVGAAGRNMNALHDLKESAPESVVIGHIDVCDPDSPHKFEELAEALGGLDIYLHCPGILIENPHLLPEEETKMVETNAVGLCRMLSAAFRYFRTSERKGRIVAVSSVAGCRGLGSLPAYSASKAFDQAYMEALRQRADELRLPIAIVDIRPGWTRTPLLDSNRKYIFEMESDKVADMIFKSALKAKRTATIGLRWRVLTFIERLLPSPIWQRLHIPLWKEIPTNI